MRVARVLGLMAATVALASRAQAAPITLNFSSTADLSAFGASASSSVQGSATWDTTSTPLPLSGINFAYYPVALSISINSVDFTSSIDFPAIQVVDASFGDSFGVMTSFFPFADLGPAPDNLYLFGGFLSGPTSMFSSTALPTNLDFLASVTSGQSQFIAVPSGIALGVGTFVGEAPPLTPVPEPSTVLLVASSLFGLVCRSTRNRNQAAARSRNAARRKDVRIDPNPKDADETRSK